MKSIYFRCEFLSDIVLNAHTATEGSSRSLNYIPGSIFLGIVAKNYADFAEKAFDVFHSSKVQFHDAHPMIGTKRSLRIPLSWYHEKDKSYHKDQFLQKESIVLYHERENDTQLKQIREGFFSSEGRLARTEHFFSLKTAYNQEKRRSSDGQIYGYDALRKGSEWIFFIQSQDGSLLETIAKKLEGESRIGRSRHSQYGKICIKRIPDPGNFYPPQPIQNNMLLLYAESSLAFFNEYGEPTLMPSKKNLLLPDPCEILWSQCHTRHRIFSPWNGIRKTRDRERICLDKGSVLGIHVPDSFDLKAYCQSIEKGLGAYLSEGMGKVLVNPAFLYGTKESHPEFAKETQLSHIQPQHSQEDIRLEETSNAIFVWTENQKQKEEQNWRITKAVYDFTKSSDAEKFLGTITSSQWGSVRSEAQKASSYQEMYDALFATETGFLMHGKSEKEWKKKNLRDIFQSTIERFHKPSNPDATRIFTIKLCSEMAKRPSLKNKETRG